MRLNARRGPLVLGINSSRTLIILLHLLVVSNLVDGRLLQRPFAHSQLALGRLQRESPILIDSRSHEIFPNHALVDADDTDQSVGGTALTCYEATKSMRRQAPEYSIRGGAVSNDSSAHSMLNALIHRLCDSKSKCWVILLLCILAETSSSSLSKAVHYHQASPYLFLVAFCLNLLR